MKDNYNSSKELSDKIGSISNPQLREALKKREQTQSLYVHYNDSHTDIWHDDWHDSHVDNWTDIN